MVEGTFSPGNVRNSLIYIFIKFLNRYRQADVVCITIYLKRLIINIETNRQSSTGSNLSILQWSYAEPDSDADDVSLLLVAFKKNRPFKCLFVDISNVRLRQILVYKIENAQDWESTTKADRTRSHTIGKLCPTEADSVA